MQDSADRTVGASAVKRKALAVAAITGDAGFFTALLSACTDVCSEIVVEGDLPQPSVAASTHPLYVEALAKARRYLDKSAQSLALTLVQAASFDRAAEILLARGDGAGPLGVLFVDAGTAGLPRVVELEERVAAFYGRLGAGAFGVVRSPYSVVVYHRAPPWEDGAHILAVAVRERLVVPDAPWLLRVEQLAALVDFVERTFEKPRNHKAALRERPAALGDELLRFLEARAGSDWLFFYYTGLPLVTFVEHVERVARRRGVLALRASDEHGLACGALANHLLHGRPFLCVVCEAMMDELRGTLANLRSAGARGFIVCPEAELGRWFPFQGTITADEDMRRVVAARGLPCVYIGGVEEMSERLEEAFRLYDEQRGPVVLLVAQAVIDAGEPPARRPALPERPAVDTSWSAAQQGALDAALAILNRERAKILWQLGALDDEEQELVARVAERAGVALADTLSHPHPSHRGGQRVTSYLGTLGLYGFNQRTHAFLHTNGRVNPRADQCIFFLKSKVGGRATNFTPFRRASLRMVQVTNRADHVAPDVELALVMDAKVFLRRTLAGLDVDPDVVRFRRAAIEATVVAGDDLSSRLPSLPMTPNYFFRELGGLFERMIEQDGYTYTGVYDVGRCSVSATRSVPRTSRGFSGWYGRALMGDAPAAMATMAATEAGNLVAFIGDGGRSIVSDPIPALLDNALAYPERFDKNITVFYFSNGTFSAIRAHRERLSGTWGGRQTRAVDLIAPDCEQVVGPLRLVRRRVTTFEPAALREALMARGRLNVLTVLLAHNDDDDGFSYVSTGWQREAL